MRTLETSTGSTFGTRLAVVAAVFAMLSACGPASPPGPPYCPGVAPDEAVFDLPAATDASDEVTRANLRLWIDLLSAPRMRGRHTTSAESRGVAALVAEHMSRLGLVAPFEDGSFCQSFPLVEETSFNVVGHVPAAGDTRRAIVLGAHYDGQGVHPAGMPYPSADDNASGVAALLEVARLARRRSWPFHLVFIALGAEEVGCVGAEFWVQQPTVALEDVALMVNFDMVGRPWPGEPATAVGFAARGKRPDLAETWWRAASTASGIETRRLFDLFAEDDMQSDDAVFAWYAPVLYVSTGLHEDHHERSDTPEQVDVDQVARAVRLTLALLEHVAGVMARRGGE